MRASRRVLLWAAIALGSTPPSWGAGVDFSGDWQVVDAPKTLHTTAGALPPLLDAARITYQANQKARASGDLAFDTTARCLPPGMPRLMLTSTPFEIVQRDTYLYMLFEYQHLNREILFRDQHAPQSLGRRFLGDSIAHWDGDTLVIDTTALKTGTLLDSAGLPHSKELHLSERLTLAPGGRAFTDAIHIEDPKTYAQPWDTLLHFRRLQHVQFKEDVCVDRQPGWFKALQKSEP